MNKYNLIIGSHVPMNKANDYLIGSYEFTINNDANAMMIYTGPPQNAKRTSTSEFHIAKFQELLKDKNISLNSVIVHAPYLINLANSLKPSVFNFSTQLLASEITRTIEIGAEAMVLHPGSAVGAKKEDALNKIIDGLNQVLKPEQNIKIALETMSGKGTEVGSSFEELQYIIDNVKLKEKVGVCWDTCHMYDAGYDIVNDLDNIINKFDEMIGLDKLFCLHINDSNNPFKSHKDRHSNLGYGYIGFDPLIKIIYHPQLDNKIKILETPYVNDNPPYKEEIAMIKEKRFTDPFGGLFASIK